jgi:hypothetical protein
LTFVVESEHLNGIKIELDAEHIRQETDRMNLESQHSALLSESDKIEQENIKLNKQQLFINSEFQRIAISNSKLNEQLIELEQQTTTVNQQTNEMLKSAELEQKRIENEKLKFQQQQIEFEQLNEQNKNEQFLLNERIKKLNIDEILLHESKQQFEHDRQQLIEMQKLFSEQQSANIAAEQQREQQLQAKKAETLRIRTEAALARREKAKQKKQEKQEKQSKLLSDECSPTADDFELDLSFSRSINSDNFDSALNKLNDAQEKLLSERSEFVNEKRAFEQKKREWEIEKEYQEQQLKSALEDAQKTAQQITQTKTPEEEKGMLQTKLESFKAKVNKTNINTNN